MTRDRPEKPESIRREIANHDGPTVAAKWREHEALLGKMADRDLADRIGVSRSRLQRYRRRLGIPSHGASPKRTAADIDAEAIAPQLGTLPDSALAAQYGVSGETIRRMRVKAGIPAHRPKRRKYTGADNHIILNHSNAAAAALLNTTEAAVKTQRSKLNNQKTQK